MLLKSADDKSKRLALLQELQRSQLLDPVQKKWLRDELMRLNKGIQGERESAHYLDHYFKDGENHVVLHDLRFVVDGEVTQWMSSYNHDRPHMALGGITPKQRLAMAA